MADDDVVILASTDGQQFNVEANVAKMSETIKNLIEDAGTDDPVPLPNVTGNILAKVVEYCKYHCENTVAVAAENNGSNEKRTNDICEWDKKFTEKVDEQGLFELILAANYLDIKDMLDMLCKTLANQLRGLTPDQIKEKYKITEPFTKEEEEQVRRENDWCEEK